MNDRFYIAQLHQKFTTSIVLNGSVRILLHQSVSVYAEKCQITELSWSIEFNRYVLVSFNLLNDLSQDATDII